MGRICQTTSVISVPNYHCCLCANLSHLPKLKVSPGDMGQQFHSEFPVFSNPGPVLINIDEDVIKLRYRSRCEL